MHLSLLLSQMANQESLSSIVWQKLRKRGSAMLGLGLIVVSIFLAIFAYLIIPENTPNANRQLPEIALQPPLFNTDCIKYQNAATGSDKSWLASVFTGFESEDEHIPYQSLELIEDELQVTNHYGQIRILSFADLGLQKMSLTELKTNHVINRRYWLGTDRYGRDILSRLILGIRVSLTVGLLAVTISVIIGIFLGSVSGYFGGWLDQVISFLINVSWSIPTLLLVFAIVLALGRGVGIIFLAVGLTMWVDVARIVRGQVLQQKNMQYVEAA
ncbi:MAG TPA: peptide transporter, partial [Saprospirales bacterium]|nr:peptide transporter [Saprospirales bacterium]